MRRKFPKGMPVTADIKAQARTIVSAVQGPIEKTQREQAFWRRMAEWAQEIKENQEDRQRRISDQTTIKRARGIVHWWLYIKDKEDEKYRIWSWD